MKVSILVITYNHEKFIKQALDSILMQKVNFDYEIVIGEDLSTDTTRSMVIDYQKQHPDRIQALLPEKNLGMIRNLVQTYKACRGEYIAILEGDDYWTSSQKLQKQVDFLDTHSDFAICFHNVRAVWEDGRLPSRLLCPLFQKRESTIEDLLLGNPAPTVAVMLRNGLIDDFPNWFLDLNYGDWPLLLLISQYGKVGYIKDQMAVYRIHPGGATSAAYTDKDKYLKNIYSIIQVYQAINKHFNFRFNYLITRQISMYQNLAARYKATGCASRLEPLMRWSRKLPESLKADYGMSSIVKLMKAWISKIRYKL